MRAWKKASAMGSSISIAASRGSSSSAATADRPYCWANDGSLETIWHFF